VTGTHGLRGDLKVRLVSGDPTSLLEAEQVRFRQPHGEITPHVLAGATAHKGNVLLRLAGRDGIDAVQDLVGCEVLMRVGDLAELAEDEYYWMDLQGLRVVDRSRGEIGLLADLFSTAAHDIYVVRGPYGEILIPAVEGIVVEVDTAGRQMIVDLPEGLVPEPNEL
jgi:16S rRNA processing protein RimM